MFESCAQQIATYVKQLRCDFRALKPGETIMACRTWTEFCTKVLKRTTRAVRYICAGGNPRSKRKPPNDWQNHWQDMPEFIQPDQTPFKTLYVHFDNQADVDKFAELVRQSITPKTRYIWFPKLEKVRLADKQYVESETACEAAL